ncbi:MAG: hypothetical protein JWM74_2915 [Myxococcaceae bacterium]|nr:hypothetical protein [Myxococcaceae bacterium]
MIGFRVLAARADAYGAAPTIKFKLHIEEPSAAHIHAIALQVQVRIEPARRRHDEAEQRPLAEVFGEPSRWGKTQRPLLWAEVSRVVPSFEGSCEIEIPIPCTYDLDLASTKYFHAIRGGDVPLLFLFRGTVFTDTGAGLAVSMLPWDREASFALAATTWREAMDSFFPDQGWLRLHRDVLDSLLAFKAQRALPTWDAVMQDLLDRDHEVTP